MKLERLPSGKYRIKKVYQGKTYRYTFDHKPSELEITTYLHEVMQNGVCKDSFANCAERYISDRESSLSVASIRTYRNLLKVISDDFKRENIYSITQEMVQHEMERYGKTHAPKSVRSLHGFISAVLAVYRSSFVLRTRLPKAKSKSPYRPNKDDIRRVLECAKGTKYYIPFKLGCLSLRRAEVCSLSDDDLVGNVLHINKTKVYDGHKWKIVDRTKTEKSTRTITLSDEIVAEIKEYGLGFDGSPKLLNNELHRICRKLGIQEFRFHDLRHYFATYASLLGLPEQDIMKVGGWESDYVFKQVYREAVDDSVVRTSKTISENLF